LENMALVLLCKLEKIFSPAFSIRYNIWYCTSRMRHKWRGPCRPVGANQSRDV
jgi:hypothetical protein